MLYFLHTPEKIMTTPMSLESWKRFQKQDAAVRAVCHNIDKKILE